MNEVWEERLGWVRLAGTERVHSNLSEPGDRKGDGLFWGGSEEVVFLYLLILIFYPVFIFFVSYCNIP